MKLLLSIYLNPDRFVCPPGSSKPNAPTNACPPGTLSNRTDLTDRSQCQQCPARYACLRGDIYLSHIYSTCSVGLSKFQSIRRSEFSCLYQIELGDVSVKYISWDMSQQIDYAPICVFLDLKGALKILYAHS